MKKICCSLALAFSATLVACGGGSSSQSAGSGSVTVGGTAATGLAIPNQTLTVTCQGASGTGTTAADGTFSVTVTGGSLPCALQLTSNGQTLRSIVAGSGSSVTANITPLTELLVTAILQKNPNALSNGVPSANAIQSTNLDAAKQAVVDFLRANDIDVSGLPDDFVGTTFVAATTSNPNAGDASDKVLDALKSAIPNFDDAKTGISTAADANDDSTMKTEASGCPAAKSGKFNSINYRGEIVYQTLDFEAMTIQATGGQPVSLTESTTFPCEFSAGTLTLNFASSGLAIFKDSDPNDVQTGILLPAQKFSKTAVFKDTYNMSGYFANNSGPAAVNASQNSGSYAAPNAQIGTARINADGSAVICGATNITDSTTTGCTPNTSSYNAQTADFAKDLNDDGSITISSPDETGVTKAFSFVAPNGKKLVVLADAITHTFLFIAKQVAIDSSKLEPYSVWYQVQGYSAYSGINNSGSWAGPATVASGTNILNTNTVTATQGSITQHFDDGTTPDRTDTILFNTTTGSDTWNGMRHRNKDTTVTPTISARTGMSVIGMGFSTNGSVNGGTLVSPTAPNTASFTLTVKRPKEQIPNNS